MVVSVVDPDGRTVATQTVDLWDVQEDTHIFDAATGRRLDATPGVYSDNYSSPAATTTFPQL